MLKCIDTLSYNEMKKIKRVWVGDSSDGSRPAILDKYYHKWVEVIEKMGVYGPGFYIEDAWGDYRIYHRGATGNGKVCFYSTIKNYPKESLK